MTPGWARQNVAPGAGMSASRSVVLELGDGRAVVFRATIFNHMCREVESEGRQFWHES